ncbi:P-loop containing nucleoside triphosphate hydrolase superfamily protein [Tanacetum coccineum]
MDPFVSGMPLSKFLSIHCIIRSSELFLYVCKESRWPIDQVRVYNSVPTRRDESYICHRKLCEKESLVSGRLLRTVIRYMPEVIIIDDISTGAACQSIVERGVMLVGSAHGRRSRKGYVRCITTIQGMRHCYEAVEPLCKTGNYD